MIMALQLVEILKGLRSQNIVCFPPLRDSVRGLYPCVNRSCNFSCLAVHAKEEALHQLSMHMAFCNIRNLSTAIQSKGTNEQKTTKCTEPTGINVEEKVQAILNHEPVDSKFNAVHGNVGGPIGLTDDSILEELSAGDLSDCPPALHEFVFTSPHPFPFAVDPEGLHPSQIKAVIDSLFETHRSPEGAGVYTEGTRWCAEEGVQTETGDEKWLQYPEPNTLWPNPLLHNHRLQPFTCGAGPSRPAHKPSPCSTREMMGQASADEKVSTPGAAAPMDKLQLHLNRLRLEQLWKHSGVHGVSWNEIDEVYLKFKQQQQQRQERWEGRKQQLLEYAGVVCARRLRAQRLEFVKSAGVELETMDEETKEQLLVPRSLFRRMTRRLFYKWHDEYFAPWRPGGLQSVLKAHITLRMLQRETNDRFMHLDLPGTTAKDCARAKPEASRAASRSEPSAEALDSNAKVLLEENIRHILRRPYVQKPVGSRGSRQDATNSSKGESDKDDVKEFDSAEETGGRTWDFTGVGRRGRRRNVPPVGCKT